MDRIISDNRLINQQLINTKLQTPKNVVSWLGAMQANGFFRIAGLPASSSWKVIYDANDGTGYTDYVLQGVTVTKGKVTTLQTVTLDK